MTSYRLKYTIYLTISAKNDGEALKLGSRELKELDAVELANYCEFLDTEVENDESFGESKPKPAESPYETDPELAESLEAMAEARQRLADVPAEVVVTNHAMGLYELGAIHLTASPPDLVEAALAIDALACLVEGLDTRLGENFEVLKDALANIRMAFVQVKNTL